MQRAERLTRIVELVVASGSVHVDDLVEALEVSPATARRDLDALAEQQLVLRTRGGARANASTGEVPLRHRGARHWRQKQRIAGAASRLVEPGDTVGFNGGTTTTAAAHELGVRITAESAFASRPVTVVTNAVNIANDLTIRPRARVVVTGGVARARSFELVGPLATMILPSIRIDVLFLGVDALDLATGDPDAQDPEEASVDAALVAAATRTVVLADSSKLGRSAFARICAASDLDQVVTDTGADSAALQALRARGLDVLVV